MIHKRSRACDISQRVKEFVWERDGHCCVVCGNPNAMPNAHYISRARGGLGIEQNIVTLCTEFGNGCHRQYDSGTASERRHIGNMLREYLGRMYPDWDESKLYYTKE